MAIRADLRGNVVLFWRHTLSLPLRAFSIAPATAVDNSASVPIFPSRDQRLTLSFLSRNTDTMY